MNTPKLPSLQPGTHEQNALWDHIYEYGHTSEGVQRLLEKVCQAYAISVIEAQGVPDGLFESQIEPRPLLYPLSDYHKAMTEGPLHYTWIDKPHRLVYDLIAAVRYYASAPPAPQSWPLPGWEVQQAQPIDDNSPSDLDFSPEGPGVDGFAKHDAVVQQEPVAWRCRVGEHPWWLEKEKPSPKLMMEIEPLYTHPAQQTKPQPLSDEQQIAEALRKHGLALVKTASGYDVMRLGKCVADGIKE